MDLSVVIPAYNESLRLGPSLRQVVSYLRRQPGSFEVLVVDDGSTDGTAEVAREFVADGVRVLRQDENRGKGAVINPASPKRAAESVNGGIVSIAKRMPRYVEPQMR